MSDLSIAKNRVKSVCGTGPEITLMYQLVQDNGWSETEFAKESVNAFPIRFSPFNRRVIETVGFHGDVDVLAYVPYEIIENIKRNVDEYTKIMILNKIYNIYKMQPYSQFDETFLYYIIGGKNT